MATTLLCFLMSSLECPYSHIVQLPDRAFRTVGACVILPRLLESVDPSLLDAVQFLGIGRVLLSFNDADDCHGFNDRCLTCCGVTIRLYRADARVRFVQLKDLPLKVPHDDVVKFLLSVFLRLTLTTASLCNGNWVIDMIPTSDIPPVVTISHCQCRVWYSRQPLLCSVCRNLVIVPHHILPLAFAGAVSRWVTWLGSVSRPEVPVLVQVLAQEDDSPTSV